jgi:hypothetical protein
VAFPSGSTYFTHDRKIDSRSSTKFEKDGCYTKFCGRCIKTSTWSLPNAKMGPFCIKYDDAGLFYDFGRGRGRLHSPPPPKSPLKKVNDISIQVNFAFRKESLHTFAKSFVVYFPKGVCMLLLLERKCGLRPYFSTPTVITFGVSFELLLFLTSNVKFFEG